MTGLRLLALTIVALSVSGSAETAAASRPDSTAATSIPAASAPSAVTRHADGSLSIRPGERFTEYFVAGRDSSGRMRMRCVQGADRARLLMRNRAFWLRPRATK